MTRARSGTHGSIKKILCTANQREWQGYCTNQATIEESTWINPWVHINAFAPPLPRGVMFINLNPDSWRDFLVKLPGEAAAM